MLTGLPALRLPLALATLLIPVAAVAQQPAPPLPTVQTPSGATQTPAAPAPATPGQPPAPAPASPNVWVPKTVADLVALDKVTARTTPLSIRVGQSGTFGSLTIAVRACEIRPPDQPADATVFLDVTDSHAGEPQFHGWMVVSAPWVSMLEHPIYDIRLVGCHE
jgi:hypothetical protein